MPQKGSPRESHYPKAAARDNSSTDFVLASGTLIHPVTDRTRRGPYPLGEKGVGGHSHISLSSRSAYNPLEAERGTELHSAEQRLSPKEHKDQIERTAGLPKSGNGHGDGGSIQGRTLGVQRSTKVRQFNTCAGTRAAHRAVGDNPAPNLGARDERITGLYTKVRDLNNLVAAYETIKSNPGSMTSGTGVCIYPDGVSLEKLRVISKELERETFQFKPVKRIYIPKANGGPRPLGIPSIRDRVVQQSMRMELERQ